jgi:hypothetical protein
VINFSIKINFSIVDQKLITELIYPEDLSFDSLEERLTILHGMVQLIENSSMPDDFQLVGTINEAHDSLINQASQLFPCTMLLKVIEVSTDVLNVDFDYGKTIHSLHNEHLYILIDGVIKALNASILLIISSINKKKKLT